MGLTSMTKVHALNLGNTWNITSSECNRRGRKQEKQNTGYQDHVAKVGSWECHFGGVKPGCGEIKESRSDTVSAMKVLSTWKLFWRRLYERCKEIK